MPNPGWLWRFFAHGFGSLAAMPARRGVHVAAARGLAPLSAFCPTNAISYICQMLFKHPDRLSFLMPAALFQLGPVGLCQWPRSICLPMAPICFVTWRQFGLRRVFACTMPCMVRLAVDVLRLMKMYGFCQCRHWPWLSARAAVVWVMCRFAV